MRKERFCNGTMTNEEKLQSLEDILHRRLEGEVNPGIIKKKLELLLLIAKIKKVNRHIIIKGEGVEGQ